MMTTDATVICHGRVISATGDFVANVLMQSGTVRAICNALDVELDVAVGYASGLYVLRGGFGTTCAWRT